MSLDAAAGRGEDVLLAHAEAALRSLGGSGDVVVTSRLGKYTRFAGPRIHQPQAIDELQLMARAVSRGGSARVATSHLDSAAWAGREAGALAKQVTGLSHREIALPGPDGVAAPAQSTWDGDSMRFDAAERGRLAWSAIQRADQIGASAHGMLSLVVVEMAVANSAGLRRYVRASEVYYSVLVRLGAGSGYRSDVGRSLARLNPEVAIDEALADAVGSQKPQSLPPGSYDVVLGPLAVGDMLGFFGALGFAESAAGQESGIVARRGGTIVADPRISIVDDGTAPIGLPIPFDVEGVSKRRVTMIDRGVVGEAVTDLETAGRLQQASTGHAHIGREQAPAPTPANLILDAAPRSSQALTEGIERGLIISRFHYTRLIDSETSAFTGVTRDACFEIREGRVGTALTQSRFSEEILPVLSRCDAVGDTLVSQPLMNVWNGVASAPALRIRGFRLGFR